MTASLIMLLIVIALPLAAIAFLVSDARPGSETALWALVIVAVPFLGPVIYLLWRAKGKSERKERV